MNTISQKEKMFLGSGWSFPVTFSAGNHQLEVAKFEQNINQSIDLILQTNMGERYMSPDFGSGLTKFVYRSMDETLKGEIKDTVTNSLLNNEPRIQVIDVTVDYEDLINGQVQITIDYVFNQTNTRHNYVFPFYIKEGTNLERTK